MKRYGFLPLVLMIVHLITVSCFAQDDHILDSLKKLVPTQRNDTNKIKTYNAITELCPDDEIAEYAWPAIRLAQKLNYTIGEANAWGNLAFHYHNLGQNDSSLICFRKAIELARKSSNFRGIANAYNNLGYIYQHMGLSQKAEIAFDSCIHYNKIYGNKGDMALVYLNLGRLFEQQGNIPKAQEHYYQGLDLYRETGDKTGIAFAYYNLGTLFEKQLDIQKAEKYYRDCLKIRLETNDKHGYSVVCSALGVLLQKQNKGDEAIKLFNEELRVSREIGFNEGISSALNNIGLYHQQKGDYKTALEFFMKARAMVLQIGMLEGIASVTRNITYCHWSLGNLKEAEQFGREAMKKALESSYPEQIYQSADLLRKIFTGLKKYKEALEMSNLFITMRDSVMNSEIRQNSLKKEYDYEYGIKEATLKAEQRQKDIITKEEKKKQQLIIYFVTAGLILVIFLSFFIYKGYRQKRNANILLEHKNVQIEEQRKIVEEKNKDITDSINYANRIQKTLLANEELLSKHLPEYFVLYKPKDIVSGDFYWAAEHNERFYLAVCDSTGHGVPGAFMSLLNIGFLSEAIKEKNIVGPGNVMDYVRTRLIQNISRDGQKDGMDGILVEVNAGRLTSLSYSAAHNSPLLVQDGKYVELSADKMPVGLSEKIDDFRQHDVTLKKGDVVYLYTDGFADQFGGEKGKKFKYRQLNEKLLEISEKPMDEQKAILESTFNTWRGKLEQVDDVLIVGLRV
jgi:serine phosphatase RsbU (regulator of sigma subunit)/Tfp pilus assembly protein PilF